MHRRGYEPGERWRGSEPGERWRCSKPGETWRGSKPGERWTWRGSKPGERWTWRGSSFPVYGSRVIVQPERGMVASPPARRLERTSDVLGSSFCAGPACVHAAAACRGAGAGLAALPDFRNKYTQST